MMALSICWGSTTNSPPLSLMVTLIAPDASRSLISLNPRLCATVRLHALLVLVERRNTICTEVANIQNFVSTAILGSCDPR